MKQSSILIFAAFLFACNTTVTPERDDVLSDSAVPSPATADTSAGPERVLPVLTVLVFPPYDALANEGISPGIQTTLEDVFASDASFDLIKFPYKKLMNVPYQLVYDKKYCKPVTDKIKTDFVIMSKIDLAARTGQMTSDKWNFQLKLLNTKTGSEFLSAVKGAKMTAGEINTFIKQNRKILFSEIIAAK